MPAVVENTSLIQIKSLIQFTHGTSLVWEALVTPLPAGVVSFSIDDGVFKLGDGVTRYSFLPTLFTFDDLVSAKGGISRLFKTPTLGQEDNIAVVVLDQGTSKMMYAPSGTTLTSLLTSLSTLEATNAAQDTTIANALAAALSIDVSINTAPDNNIVVINGGKYADSGVSVASITSQVSSGTVSSPATHMDEVLVYLNQSLNKAADKLNLSDNNTYYVNIPGFGSSTIVTTLTCANTNVVITNISGSLYSVKFNGVTSGTKAYVPVTLIASADDGTGKALIKKAITTLVYRNKVLTSVYGTTVGSEQFSAVTTDSQNNIICVGATVSEGKGSNDGLIVKFDQNLNTIARCVYGGTSPDFLNGVAVDSNDNIFVCGYTQSEGTGTTAYFNGVILKFGPNLNILLQYYIGGANHDYIYGVAIDKLNNVIIVGQTYSEGTASDAFVYKFNNNLSVLFQKRYGAASAEQFNGVACDSNNNIICVGQDYSEGTGGECLVIKFDPGLNILARKIYGGSSSDTFTSVAVDKLNNIICAGYTNSEGTSGDCLVVKFDTNLAILYRIRYGGSATDQFLAVAVDSSNNVIGFGYTTSEGTAGDALVVKFDPTLALISRKRYGAANNDYFYGGAVDNNGNIIGVGNTTISVNTDALVVKLPSNMPAGTFTGTTIAHTLADSVLTLATSALTLQNSVLAINSSTLTIAALTTMNLQNSLSNQLSDSLG